jgi:hypothetical protein
VLYEESSGTLLCGDLFIQVGNAPALTSSDVVGPRLRQRIYSISST